MEERNASPKAKKRRDGTPEPYVIQFGLKLAQLRSGRKLSRNKLAIKLARKLPEGSQLLDACSQELIKRLEEGKVVKITRELVEALSAALNCTPQERADLLLYADRNVLGNGSGVPDSTERMFNQVMDSRYREMKGIMDDLIAKHQPVTLRDMQELVDTAWEIVRQANEDEDNNTRTRR